MVSRIGSDGLTAVVSTETRARLPSAAATARHWTAAALISGWYAPVTSSTRGTAGRSGKGANHHIVEQTRGSPDVELGSGRVERCRDAERAVAPPAYQIGKRRRDRGLVVRRRGRTSETTEHARGCTSFGRDAEDRLAERQVV